MSSVYEPSKLEYFSSPSLLKCSISHCPSHHFLFSFFLSLFNDFASACEKYIIISDFSKPVCFMKYFIRRLAHVLWDPVTCIQDIFIRENLLLHKLLEASLNEQNRYRMLSTRIPSSQNVSDNCED